MNSKPEILLKILSDFSSQSSDAIVIADETGIIQWVNRKTCSIFGCREEDMTGLHVDLFSLSIDSDRRIEYLKSDGRKITIQKVFKTSEDSGKSWQMIIVTDVSVPETYESEQKPSVINTPVNSDSAAVNIWSVDVNFNYTFFNENHKAAMKNIWGADIRLGSYILDYLKDNIYIDQVKAIYNKLISGTTHRSVDHFTTLSGEEKYLENFGHPMKNAEGDINGIMFYTIDITGKMEVENKLKLSISLLESIMNSPDEIHIMSLDTEYRYIFFNNAHRDSMQQRWQATPGIGKNIFDLLPESKRKKVVKKFYDRAMNGEILSKTSEFINDDGTWTYYDNISAPIMDSEGTITGITIFTLNTTERVRAEQKIRESLEEKDILLKEIHHRVKNNLQMITSMMNLQLDLVEDKKARHILQDSLSRVNTMGLIHKALYQGDNLANISMKEYCWNLLETIMEFFHSERKRISIISKFDEIRLDIDQAIPVGLIINELVTNSMKYAFTDREEGEIKLNMSRTPEGEIHLRVSDNGWGLRKGLDIRKTETLGLRLLEVFVRQLNGRIEFDSDNGLTADIYFK